MSKLQNNIAIEFQGIHYVCYFSIAFASVQSTAKPNAQSDFKRRQNETRNDQLQNVQQQNPITLDRMNIRATWCYSNTYSDLALPLEKESKICSTKLDRVKLVNVVITKYAVPCKVMLCRINICVTYKKLTSGFLLKSKTTFDHYRRKWTELHRK